ncbi:MAG: hypothetical protein J2P35_10935 [Actinobacteria bacterium]|nr:hypothetical protein [Actinomycetota bacterium]MBO0784755.1 hypothetical protein [Actinomycetota bacterium]MBO0818277.1 hypothetical protein [Actinomycetota bacterium]
MADQVSPGAVAGRPEGAPDTHPAAADSGPETFHGRGVSWVAVSIIMAGFIAGGIALVAGPLWWLFWVGAGLAVVGGLLGLSTHIMDDWY